MHGRTAYEKLGIVRGYPGKADQDDVRRQNGCLPIGQGQPRFLGTQTKCLVGF